LLEESLHQIFPESTTSTEAGISSTSIPAYSQPVEEKTTTLDPSALNYYYVYKALQRAEVEEKKDEYHQVSISSTLNARILRTNVLSYVCQSQNITR